MKRILTIAVLTMLVLTGCNTIGGVFQPIIGTWNAEVLGVTTTLVFNADKTCTDTTTTLGIGVTESGTWTSNDNTISRIFSDNVTSTLYYSFNSDHSQMTLSSSPDGLATTYTRM